MTDEAVTPAGAAGVIVVPVVTAPETDGPVMPPCACAGRIGCPVRPRVLPEGLQLERQVHADVGVRLQRRLDRIRLLLVRARCNSPP